MVSLDFYTTISIPLSCLFKFLHNSSLEPTGSRELLFPQYHFSRLIAVQLVIVNSSQILWKHQTLLFFPDLV